MGRFGLRVVPEVASDSPSDWLSEAPVEAAAATKTGDDEVSEVRTPAAAIASTTTEPDYVEEVVVARAPPRPVPVPPRDIGGGGVKHKYIEHLIKELGEERRFRATVEEPIHDGAGRADVILRRGEISLAFEISVTTTKDHELGNIEKCLSLPFTHVAMLASHARHLKGLSTHIDKALEDEERKRVSFLLPEDLPGFLDGYPQVEAPKEKTVKGYTQCAVVSRRGT